MKLLPFLFSILAAPITDATPVNQGQVSEPALDRGTTNASEDGFQYLNSKTRKYLVDGKSIPEVKFDVGESYAGLLPMSPSSNSSLFFWFFPTSNPKASDEITIWLNGGPGDSSLNGMLLATGPFLWQPGTDRPIPNPYAWNNLTNVVYIDQPAGTGYSLDSGTVGSVIDIAEQFTSWFKNFATTFGLERRKVYITGESYAGHMIPYIASRMLDDKNNTYSNVRGVQIVDGVINSFSVIQQAPVVAAVKHFNHVMKLNDTFISDINTRSEQCGYNKFLSEVLTYPPSKKVFATPDKDQPGCSIWSDVLTAAFKVNPCFNTYHLTDRCPTPESVMDDGPNSYFNREDVKKVLHVPPKTYYKAHGGFAWSGFPGVDGLAPRPSALGPLPRVIELTNNTIIAHGLQDFLLLANGSLATIQNMTWNGYQGFQKAPTEPLVVPYGHQRRELDYREESAIETGVRVEGNAHTERGLTFVSIDTAGHGMCFYFPQFLSKSKPASHTSPQAMPQYTPGAAYRQLEFLLGRIENLQQE
ncbi:peptidase S10 family protein [Metarhizium robertsii]|uniref:Carboxypeptidase n=2 Tax=Metarhizium robertsii TaxID=568076 RepID=E9FDH3_METRA|nr:serine-type carboxypeptidase F [Metarhizium robertsii ARSEF 23]EFY94224.2 serine-type carboxypeptidase F [Metarhizium robertsii ARSEF 23]EXU95529.1 peptidase S10 family protein [Metarhizium robertsii]